MISDTHLTALHVFLVLLTTACRRNAVTCLVQRMLQRTEAALSRAMLALYDAAHVELLLHKTHERRNINPTSKNVLPQYA